jgi:hypothetical protein
MKLSKLLELHSILAVPHSLTDNFGDGLLCKSNKIYRNIRLAAVRHAFKFSAEPNNFYSALPLSQLKSILTEKKIPYADNVLVLKELEKSFPQLTMWDDIQDNLKRNFIFHETCHAVARSEAAQISCDAEPEVVLQMLLEESFANTCELFGVIDALEPAHRIFYEINSYSSLFDHRAFLKSASLEIGEVKLFQFLLLSYLHSNFLSPNLNDNQFNKILKFISVDCKNLAPASVKNLKMLAKVCFTLDERFKLVTTRFYLKLSGVQKGQHDLLNFDFMALMLENTSRSKLIERLAVIATAN